MQSENSNLKIFFEQSVTKQIFAALLVIFLLLSTFIIIGLKSQYITVNFCVVNCSQTPERGSDDDQVIEIIDDSSEGATLPPKPIRITVKPLGAAIVAGGISTAAMAALIGLGIVSLPVELALVLGAVIGSGTYFALKTLY